MENPGNTANKHKAPETSGSAQALQVVTGMPPTPTLAGSTLATLVQTAPRVVASVADPPRHSTSSDTSMEEISPALLGAIQQIVSIAIREQEAGNSSTSSTRAITEYDGTTDSVEHLAPFENAALLLRYTNGIKCRVFVTTFARAAMFASSRKLQKIELSLFVVRQKDNEPLKEYLQRFNTTALEVPSATQEVNASAFSQGLLDRDFFKSLAKKPISKFDALLPRAAKYINMEDAQTAKKESRGNKARKRKKALLTKEINAVYTPLTVPITQALMAVEGKWLLARPRSWKEGPQRPQLDKFCRFHNDYGHTMEECRHLKNEIKRLIQNGYLKEYVCWVKLEEPVPTKRKKRTSQRKKKG
ncbi:UNVERIFIED_CONTAM: hypothetical protein Slati_2170500 [Sesamum latifolium]|uniref:Retrotransposon gag domain-containing protein n=1 Tax=Sesamum latifolium TaxID=2727402 RepID=A0AAW2WSF5_9LAMI